MSSCTQKAIEELESQIEYVNMLREEGESDLRSVRTNMEHRIKELKAGL